MVVMVVVMVIAAEIAVVVMVVVIPGHGNETAPMVVMVVMMMVIIKLRELHTLSRLTVRQPRIIGLQRFDGIRDRLKQIGKARRGERRCRLHTACGGRSRGS
jgi:hypothetical protein